MEQLSLEQQLIVQSAKIEISKCTDLEALRDLYLQQLTLNLAEKNIFRKIIKEKNL
ncbi:MAG: hypothetical protein ACRCYP_00830 [Alphaproteobacteria bacterium]